MDFFIWHYITETCDILRHRYKACWNTHRPRWYTLYNIHTRTDSLVWARKPSRHATCKPYVNVWIIVHHVINVFLKLFMIHIIEFEPVQVQILPLCCYIELTLSSQSFPIIHTTCDAKKKSRDYCTMQWQVFCSIKWFSLTHSCRWKPEVVVYVHTYVCTYAKLCKRHVIAHVSAAFPADYWKLIVYTTAMLEREWENCTSFMTEPRLPRDSLCSFEFIPDWLTSDKYFIIRICETARYQILPEWSGYLDGRSHIDQERNYSKWEILICGRDRRYQYSSTFAT